MNPAEFEQLVEKAVSELPDRFANLLENVVIVVEEEPGEEDLDATEDDELLGLYRGIALPNRTYDMLPALPDQIAIFRGPILRVAHSRREIIREVRETIIHELGHYFGLHDDEMVF